MWKSGSADLKKKKEKRGQLPYLLVEIKLRIWAFVGQCNYKDRAANKMQKIEMQSSISEAEAKHLESVTNLAAELV